MNVARTALVVGLIIWAAATAILVPLGHFVFGPDTHVPSSVWAIGIVGATFFGVYRLATRILQRAGAAGLADGALFGAMVCAPGLLLDGALYALGGGNYPKLDASASGAMSATLMFAYAAALFGALGAGNRARS